MEPRFTVRDGLRRLLAADPDAWPGASPLVFRGRLLDEVGSDARPLVILLAKAADWGVHRRLVEARTAREPWERVRGPLVMSLVDEHFLQADMAQWAVETWAFALDVIAEPQLTPGIARPMPAPAQRPVPTPTVAPATAPRAARPAGPGALGVAAPRGTPYRPPNAPVGYRPPRPNVGPLGGRAGAGGPHPKVVRATLWASGIVSGLAIIAFATMIVRGRSTVSSAGYAGSVARSTDPAPPVAPGAATPAATTPGTASPTAAAPTAPAAPSASASPLAAIAASQAEAARTTAPAPAPANPSGQAAASLAARYGTYAPAYAAGTGATGPVPVTTGVPGRLPDPTALGIPKLPTALPGVTDGALPATPQDSAKLYVVRPPVRATLPLERAAPPPGTAKERPGLGLLNVGTGQLDRVRLRNGTVRQGRVAIVHASSIEFIDAKTRLREEIPKREIDAIQTEFGNVVTFSSDGKATKPVEPPLSPVVAKGVGGTYDVRYDVRSVTGSPECRQLWRAPPAPDVVVVNHRPRADTLSLAVRGGGTFSAVIDPEGAFATSLLPQPEASIGSSAITSRMSGQFTSAGFTGEVNIIGYRRQPTGQDITCHSVLTATASRRK